MYFSLGYWIRGGFFQIHKFAKTFTELQKKWQPRGAFSFPPPCFAHIAQKVRRAPWRSGWAWKKCFWPFLGSFHANSGRFLPLGCFRARFAQHCCPVRPRPTRLDSIFIFPVYFSFLWGEIRFPNLFRQNFADFSKICFIFHFSQVGAFHFWSGIL